MIQEEGDDMFGEILDEGGSVIGYARATFTASGELRISFGRRHLRDKAYGYYRFSVQTSYGESDPAIQCGGDDVGLCNDRAPDSGWIRFEI